MDDFNIYISCEEYFNYCENYDCPCWDDCVKENCNV